MSIILYILQTGKRNATTERVKKTNQKFEYRTMYGREKTSAAQHIDVECNLCNKWFSGRDECGASFWKWKKKKENKSANTVTSLSGCHMRFCILNAIFVYWQFSNIVCFRIIVWKKRKKTEETLAQHISWAYLNDQKKMETTFCFVFRRTKKSFNANESIYVS